MCLLKMPYTGARNVPELSEGPDHVEAGLDARLGPAQVIALTPEENDREAGRWHRMGLACGHLAAAVAGHAGAGRPVLGLLANCTSALGMLGGVQAARGGVGLVWIDAHADFNTPETTLSGLLGGMPVAIAAGLCLHRMRRQARLDPPLPAGHIVMAGLRDLDRLEQGLLDDHAVQQVELGSPQFIESLGRLADTAGAIYVHVDMDVLDPSEVPGHPFAVPGGPGSADLALLLENVCSQGAVAAFGLASTPPARLDPQGIAKRAAHRLVEAAARGLAAAGTTSAGRPVED